MMHKSLIGSDVATLTMFQSLSRGIKSQQSQLSQELASGKTADIGLQEQEKVPYLAEIARKDRVLKQYVETTNEAIQLFDVAQIALKQITQSTTNLSETLILPVDFMSNQALNSINTIAHSSFESIITSLNTTIAGQYAFSGQESNKPPIAPPDEFLSQFLDSVDGSKDALEVLNHLDAFFESGGLFEVSIYQGSQNARQLIRVSEDNELEVPITAADESFRVALKSALLAISASELESLSVSDRDILFNQAKLIALNAGTSLTLDAGRIGFMQEEMDENKVRLSSEIAAMEITKEEFLSVDPFETASRLEAVNSRLEYLYMLVARSQNLTFLEYFK